MNKHALTILLATLTSLPLLGGCTEHSRTGPDGTDTNRGAQGNQAGPLDPIGSAPPLSAKDPSRDPGSGSGGGGSGGSGGGGGGGSPVPEPATLLLVGAGLAGGAALYRRRRTRQEPAA